ncbi:hypothetical protein BDN72DRAFT_742055, partial [Pluteus cervinus]
KKCRFGLSEDLPLRDICFNADTGEIEMARKHGMVNNYNRTVIRCCRCNMDIKFVGSGPTAKAMMYYATDYITKPGLTMYESYAALDRTLSRLEKAPAEDTNPNLDPYKRIFRKCVFGQLSQQELSAQQVATLLMDYDDHFTSHEFRKLYWTNLERRLSS